MTESEKFGEELKLYLSYPSEIEYWYDYQDDDETREYANNLLREIVGSKEEDQSKFLNACKNVYDQALNDFNRQIVDRIINKMILKNKKLNGNDGRYRASIPREMKRITRYVETRLQLPSENIIKGGVGCAFMVVPCQEENCGSQLVAYPRVWFPNRNAVATYIERINSNINLCNSNDVQGIWDRNIAFVCEGIPILLGASPQEMVKKITKYFDPMYDGLIA